jgi:O-antigen/teichoic acid export membrane protein
MSTLSNAVVSVESVCPHSGRAHTAIFHGMLGRIAILGANLLTGILTARFLAPAGRGEQAAMILWPVLLANATSLGLPVAVTYHLRKGTTAKAELVACGLLMALSISLAVSIVAAVLMPGFLAHYPQSTVTFARLFLLTVPIGSFMLVARAVMEAEENYSVSIRAQLFLPSLTLVLLVLLILFGVLTPVTAAVCYAANGIPVAIWLFVRLRKSTALLFANIRLNTKTLLAYGIPAYGIDLCGTLAQYVDQALVVHFLLPQAMGVYAVALSASRMLNFCQTSVTMVLLPKAAAMDADSAVRLTVKAARSSLFVTGLVAAAAIVVAPFAIRLLYGNSFRDAVIPLRLLLVEAVLGGTVMVLAQAALALGKPILVTSLQLCGLATTVPLLWFLLPRYGLVGAGEALLLSTTLRFVLILACYPWAFRHPIPRLIIRKEELLELCRLASGLLGLDRHLSSSTRS